MLCEDCCEELAGPIAITPEQIERTVVVTNPTSTALVDSWGRPHRLDRHTTVGRAFEGPGLQIFEPSVSRNHAELVLHDHAWTLRDLGSANGTFVDNQLVEQIRLHDRARLRFGHIGLFFIEDASALPPPPARTVSKTLNTIEVLRMTGMTIELDHGPLPAAMTFTLREPTGGGGGLVEIDGKQIQLTIPQFELIALLVDRMTAEADQREDVRGFVPGSELLAKLSLESPEPADGHIRQLVRRVRRTLMKASIGDLIESRPGSGYRLRVLPRRK